jgi:hypothetical protein
VFARCSTLASCFNNGKSHHLVCLIRIVAPQRWQLRFEQRYHFVPAPSLVCAPRLHTLCRAERVRGQAFKSKTMAANPALVSSPDGLAPAPFQGETIALARHGVDIAIDGLRTANGK